jgi:hypothetical protein
MTIGFSQRDGSLRRCLWQGEKKFEDSLAMPRGATYFLRPPKPEVKARMAELVDALD